MFSVFLEIPKFSRLIIFGNTSGGGKGRGEGEGGGGGGCFRSKYPKLNHPTETSLKRKKQSII